MFSLQALTDMFKSDQDTSASHSSDSYYKSSSLRRGQKQRQRVRGSELYGTLASLRGQDYEDPYGSLDKSGQHSSGYGGHSGHGGGGTECCPLVVDPLTLTALLGFIAASTALLNTVITMNLTGRRRRRAMAETSNTSILDGWLQSGKGKQLRLRD